MSYHLLCCLLFVLLLIQNIQTLTIHQSKKPKATKSSIQYPIRFTYVNKLTKWWPPQQIAKSLGVPKFASSTIYNYFAYSFWSCSLGPLDTVLLWDDPVKYFGADSVFGKTKDSIQKSIKKKYNDNGSKLFISAFGATEFPTTQGLDPIDCAKKLGKFVLSNNLDGVDIDYQDNSAMQAGTGEQWLIKFQTQLRKLLPNHIISHAPQGPYFKQDFYKNGGYITVDKKVGNTIDFYNVQFYNQGNTAYNSYQSLFKNSGSVFSGTSVGQIISKGVPSKKIVVGKPVTQADATNTGLVDQQQLGKWAVQYNKQKNWYAGIMFWQYSSDLNGNAIKNSAGALKDLCAASKKCI